MRRGAAIGALSFRSRLRGSYFALVTLAFAEVLRIIASVAPITGAGVGTIIKLDLNYLQHEFIPTLIQRHLFDSSHNEYNLAVISILHPERVIYSSSNALVDFSSSDASTRIFGLEPEELSTFLARPILARLATVRANGTPQIVPMWFLYEDGVMYMSTRTNAAKVKHFKKNPHVAVVVDEMVAPMKNKAVTIGPDRIGGVVAQELLPQAIRDGRQAHGRARMSGVRLLDRIHRQGADGVDAQLVEIDFLRRRWAGLRGILRGKGHDNLGVCSGS
jgi:hypothetical protein